MTFEEIDDHCSDIGCMEKEGVDFHIESVEVIDTRDIGSKVLYGEADMHVVCYLRSNKARSIYYIYTIPR